LAVGVWYYFRNRTSPEKVDLTNYEQDPIAKEEMESRNLSYNGSGDNSLFNILTSKFYEGYDLDTYKGVFPMFQESASIFTAEKRAGNLAIAKEMIARYDTLVKEASVIHRVPRLLIYGVMLAEHERSVPLKQAESFSRPGSKYIGLMQISATTAKDSLIRNIKIKQLSSAQMALFTKKGIIKGVGSAATVNVTSNQLRSVDINIHAGAEYLSRHINSWGIYQPEKIVVSYNQGEGALRRDGLTRSTPNEIYAFYKRQTSGQIVQVKGYILKILGKHGACDILFNDLGIKD
jgi:hypothetical protein